MSYVLREKYNRCNSHYRVCYDCKTIYQIEANVYYTTSLLGDRKEKEEWCTTIANVLCDECGHFIRTAKQPEIHNLACPECGNLLTKFVCPKCGSDRYRDAKDKDVDKACFISTACVLSKKLPDNCHELTILRKWRDILQSEDEEMKKMIEEYYVYAPKIVAQINLEPNSLEIYDTLYNELVLPTVHYLEEGKIDVAKSTYIHIYEKLKEKYIK